MLGGYAMSDDFKTKTAAFLNAVWDGSPIKRLRVLTGTSFAPGRRFSVHLMVQPGVSEKLLHDDGFADIGLLARLLVVAPESTVGTRFHREAPRECDAVLRDYGERMAHFLNKAPPLREGGNGLAPYPLPMSGEARRMLIAFHDVVESEIAPGGRLSTIKGFASKMAEHAGRLAAVLAAYADPDLIEIDAESMGNGTALALHYASEVKRLSDGAAIAPDLKLARQLMEWWRARSERKCHLAEIYQRGPNPLRDAATAKRIADILVEHGHLTRLPPGTMLDGSPRRDAGDSAMSGLLNFDPWAAIGKPNPHAKAITEAAKRRLDAEVERVEREAIMGEPPLPPPGSEARRLST